MNLKRLFLLGDIGLFNNPLNKIVNYIQNDIRYNDALVILGDNFYPSGINDSCDIKVNQFNNIFKNINKPIYSILGNHDYLENPIAQINHTNWIMPNFYYKQEYENIDLFFLDTVLFNKHSGLEKFKIENIHNNSISNLINEELNWFENELKLSNKKKIVFGHYPIISNGYYKNKKDTEIFYYLIDLFKKYNILTYISGHEHNIQYIRRIYDNYVFNQIILGSSSENRYFEDDKSSGLDMYDNKNNFYGILNIVNNTIEYINKDNEIIYKFEL